MRNLLRKSFLKRLFSRLKNYWYRLFRRNEVDERALLPVIIFQPGKVGSSSVHASLQKTYAEFGISVPVYHAHVLENIDKRIEYITKHRTAPANSIKKLLESKELGERIKEHPEQVWNVINLVREPVAMKVSALFQVLHEYIPDWENRLKQDKLSMDELDEILYKKQELGTSGLELWYDNQIKALWGIDVFKEPFSKENGYQIYRRENVNLIILRLEDLNRVAEKAFDDFLGIKDFRIISVNVGEEKSYAELYQKFKQRALPAHYVDEVYKTRFARHFYSDSEIEQFRQKWTKSGTATGSNGRAQIDARLLTPIVIFQPGKVGSMSVMASLKQKFKNMGLSTAVYHAHRLEKIDEQIEFVKKARNAPSNTINKLIESKELRHQIDTNPEQAWNVLTLVRDPVAQRVSALFQLIHEYIPGWQDRLRGGQLTLPELQNMLFEKEEFDIQRLDNWFDEQLKPVWGVDVYQLPFNCDLGYQVYKPNPRVNLMVMRLENLDNVAKKAFYEFIGIRNFSVVHTNTSEEKPYRELYDQFKALPLPSTFVEAAYNTRYARHFYSTEELQAFRKKWLNAN